VIGYALLGALLFFLLYNSLGLVTAFIQGNCAWGSIEVKGSSAFYDEVNRYAQGYHAACPIGFLTVNEEPNASVSLTDLKNHMIQIAPSEMPASFAHSISSDFEDHPVAVIVFTVVVNKGVTGITSLSREQLRGIYAGKYLKWSAVDNRAPDIPIIVFGRPTGSGTYTTFTRYVLGLDARVQPTAPTYQIAERTDLMAQAVAQTPGAIGYVDMRRAGQMSSAISPVGISGSIPTPALVENDAYPFWAIEHMYINRNPDKLVTSFINYVTQHTETNDTLIKLQDMPINILQMRAALDNVA
jgi:phosphate transport system substrate-binding protein